MVEARIEFHPENGTSPHVVVVPTLDGGAMWFAYRTRERAEEKLPMIAREYDRTDGMIEIEGPIDISVRYVAGKA